MAARARHDVGDQGGRAATEQRQLSRVQLHRGGVSVAGARTAGDVHAARGAKGGVGKVTARLCPRRWAGETDHPSQDERLPPSRAGAEDTQRGGWS